MKEKITNIVTNWMVANAPKISPMETSMLIASILKEANEEIEKVRSDLVFNQAKLEEVVSQAGADNPGEIVHAIANEYPKNFN